MSSCPVVRLRGAPLQGVIVFLAVLPLQSGRAQVTLPSAPEGFQWQSQGVSIYTDTDSFSVELSGVTNVNTPGTFSVGSHILAVTAFDATPGVGQFIYVHASSLEVAVTGSTSAIVFNSDAAVHSVNGSVSLPDWTVSGAVSGGPVSESLVRTGVPLTIGAGTPGIFTDEGTGLSTLFQDFQVTGAAPTDGSLLTMSVAVGLELDVSGTGSVPLVIATGSGFGDASVQTVYEVFDLVAIPEPGLPVLAGVTLLGLFGLRRRR